MPAVDAASRITPRVRALLAVMGIGLTGYGALVVLQVLPHDAMVAGLASLGIGLVMLLAMVPGGRALGPVSVRKRRLVAAVGLVAIVGVLGYNMLAASGLGVPEWAILAYGMLLVVASRYLERRVGRFDVGILVAWSFPILLAPLTMYAVNAMLTTRTGDLAASPWVHGLVVLPAGWTLALLGAPVDVVGNSLVLPGPNGRLVLNVGLVCAGLYPMALFGGIIALHAWDHHVPGGRLATYVATGLAGLWAMNIVRIIVLVQVGERWGGATVEEVHAHIGWVFFAVFMLAFWSVVLRFVERPAAAPSE